MDIVRRTFTFFIVVTTFFFYFKFVFLLQVLTRNVIPLVACNTVGVVSCICFLVIFIRLAKTAEDKNRTKRLAAYACTFISIVFMACSADILVVMGTENSSSSMTVNGLGTIGTISAIGMFSSPIAEFSRSIRTRSTKTLSAPLALASFVCGFLWVCLGLDMNDIYVWFPNGVGVLVSTCQLFLFVRFGYERRGGYDLVLPAPTAPKNKTFELSSVDR